MQNQVPCLTTSHVLSRVSQTLHRLAAWIILPSLLFIVLGDIVARQGFDAPLPWAHEVLGLLMLGFWALALPGEIEAGSLMTVDLFPLRQQSGWKNWERLSAGGIAFSVGLALIVMSGQSAWDMYRFEERTYTFFMPLWPIAVLPGVAGLLIVLRTLLRVLTSLLCWQQRRPK